MAKHSGRERPSTPPANGLKPFVRDLFSRELLRYLGPGFVVTIGFIDPGNWATNIAGGSRVRLPRCCGSCR